MVVSQRECRTKGPCMSDSEDGPPSKRRDQAWLVRCTLCAKVLCTTCAAPVMALQDKEFETEGVVETQAAASKAAAMEAEHIGLQSLT